MVAVGKSNDCLNWWQGAIASARATVKATARARVSARASTRGGGDIMMWWQWESQMTD